MVTKSISKTMFYFFMGIGIIAGLCVYELFYGAGLTHPMWDRDYSWLPLFQYVGIASVIGGVTHALYLQRGPTIEKSYAYKNGRVRYGY